MILLQISAIADPVNIKSKTGKEFIKRTISIMDNSNGATTIDCTLWNEHAQTFKGQVGMTMAVKGGRISDFNGTSRRQYCTLAMAFDVTLRKALRSPFAMKRQWSSIRTEKRVSL